MIPDGQIYMSGDLGAGSIATIEDYTASTQTAGADIKFGAGVSLANGKVVPATSGNIYGVALKRNYANTVDFKDEDIEADHFNTGELVAVLRDGTVSVLVSADVNAGDNATVGADGIFKPAGNGDTVVGVFTTNGNANGTASMQTRIQFASPTATPTTTTTSGSTTTTK